MTCQLPADCLNEIFEYLAEDKISLRSCLLVNRSWCEVAVRIFWRNIFSINHREHIPLSTLRTIIACLPNESKELIYFNEIVVRNPILNPPIFNYLSFVKVLSIYTIGQIIEDALRNRQIDSPQSLYFIKYLMLQELLKGFMSQISSLKSLDYNLRLDTVQYMPFSYFPGAKDCLKDLTEFRCDSNIYPEFCFQISQICHNIQSLTIEFKNNVSDGLKDLITFQVDLEYLNLIAFDDKDWKDIIPALTKHHNRLTKLHIHTDKENVTFSFIALFENLQELLISDNCSDRYISDFDELQNVIFPKLRILKIPDRYPQIEIFTKFLENNGSNLVELTLADVHKSVKLSISRFCPILKKLYVLFEKDEMNILKDILDSCQYLESIKVWCGHNFLNEKELLEVIASYSPKNFNELKIYNDTRSELIHQDMESFFLSWGNRIPHRPLNLFVIKNNGGYSLALDVNEENIITIEKYRKLGVIKKFGIENFDY
ncbi:4359_t:CDS:1 [Funneliformis geosporum]|uniref:4359_t:CDS:1 n=1 Tax=Funneliformis geosporum TaxID=1117311 RepID=A0A9W4X1A2_9GLOM|nr:4359_t:CDS:1 [Funneliformis geosporum]